MKKMIAINGSPRAMWNTGTLVREAAKGRGNGEREGVKQWYLLIRINASAVACA